MALYHLHVKNISRGDGRSAVAAAAYRAGETLENAAEERLSKFAGRRDVLGAEIHLPADAPAWMADRTTLWNRAEAAERRKDARLAKEVEFSIPRELPRAAWFEVARAMAAHYTAQGFVVDLAVHDDGTGHNPHVHLLLTTRLITIDGFGGKLRAADSKTFLKDTRATWQAIANAALAKAGVAVMIDAGSYVARGIEREPGEHLPPDPAARRQRRQEVAAMLRDSDLAQAIEQLAADPTARSRYPLLSQAEDWPPREPARGAKLFLSPEAREERRYWREVHERAVPSVIPNAEAQEHEVETAPSRSTDDEVDDLFRKVQAATLKEGLERRQAFVENARDYEKLFRRVNREMVQAGVLKIENVRSWESVSRAFRDEGFDQLLAEARALEAKRNEPDRTLRATPAQIAALPKLEREEEERRGVPFTPGTGTGQVHTPMPMDPPVRTLEAAQTRMLREYEREESAAPPVGGGPTTPQRETPPDPFAYLASNPTPERAEFEAAQDRMVTEYQRDDRAPPDPFDWLNQQSPAPPLPAPKQDRDQDQEQDRKREPEWKW